MRYSEGTASKIPGSEIETRWVLVTPEIAKLYLVANTENRNQRLKHIDRLVSDMTEDRFLITHQGIAFDENGEMIDGQHRCEAIIESGKNQWMLVTTGLPSEAKRVIDGGAKRAAHDFMPGKFKALRAGGIRIMLAIEACGYEFTGGELAFQAQQVTSAAIQENWDTFHNEFDEMCHLAHHAAKSVATCGPSALLAAGLQFPSTAKEFLVGLAAMTGLEAGDPRLALLKFRGGPKRIQTSTAAVVALKAAKALNEGKQINVLRYSPNERVKVG